MLKRARHRHEKNFTGLPVYFGVWDISPVRNFWYQRALRQCFSINGPQFRTGIFDALSHLDECGSAFLQKVLQFVLPYIHHKVFCKKNIMIQFIDFKYNLIMKR